MRYLPMVYVVNLLFVAAPMAFAEMELAITVDDLPTHSSVPMGVDRVSIAKKLLKALTQYHVPEVYGLINAVKISEDPASLNVLKQWLKSGYPLGNHTFSHKNINRVPIEEFKVDIEKNEQLLKELTRDTGWRFFRYPFLIEGGDLERRNAIRGFLKDRGYTIAQVTVDFKDWSWNAPYTRCSNKKKKDEIRWLRKSYVAYAKFKLQQAKAVTDYIYKRPVKHILLLHIGAFDAEMLEEVLHVYKDLGVKFIPLSDAIKDEIYSYDPGQVSNHGDEFTFQVMKARGVKLKDIGLPEENVYPEDKLNSICK